MMQMLLQQAHQMSRIPGGSGGCQFHPGWFARMTTTLMLKKQDKLGDRPLMSRQPPAKLLDQPACHPGNGVCIVSSLNQLYPPLKLQRRDNPFEYFRCVPVGGIKRLQNLPAGASLQPGAWQLPQGPQSAQPMLLSQAS
ncbi:hypothetical protein TKWG_07030 [Advenella kashmirensis WT001]|uniref:Uncharacterized protein n=1 Tax=Advenella kashmirensis (strain DSM 17095 / LMG 22695 / WT001) TaxID=1036672 RepID=I3UA01_ADVKW|nr:hypothetical protein TKWG_07030 [Advenella kashmirensis WT001]